MRINTEEEWLALRRKVVTASEAASIFGLNPYQSANQMWKNKSTNQFVDSPAIFIGRLLEKIVVDVTNHVMQTNYKIIEDETGKVFYLSENKKVSLGATPDAADGVILLECKTTKPWNFLKYKYFPPKQYIIQVLIQLYCTNQTIGYLSIMSTNLTQHTLTLELPVAVFRITLSEDTKFLIEHEMMRFWDTIKQDKMFRTNSKIKTLMTTLVHWDCEKIY